ncbi:IDEAL domain-containing protein [Priestia flexa]|uniref:IDEAL domain-containing protein n=1 Tax=Priestia flexa TaxID=86664 RepID=UPI001B32D62F|nr:IDEAL domain-containing protein [Priestia flexa]
MKKNLLNSSPKSNVKVLDSLIAEMFLDKVIANFQKAKLKKEIDQSLEEKNKEDFLKLTNQLKNIS